MCVCAHTVRSAVLQCLCTLKSTLLHLRPIPTQQEFPAFVTPFFEGEPWYPLSLVYLLMGCLSWVTQLPSPASAAFSDPPFHTDRRLSSSLSGYPCRDKPAFLPLCGSEPLSRSGGSFQATASPGEQTPAPPNGFGIAQGRISVFPVSALGLGLASPRDDDVPVTGIESWGPAGEVMGLLFV